MLLSLKIKGKELPTIISGHCIVDFAVNPVGEKVVKVHITSTGSKIDYKNVEEAEVFHCGKMIKRYKLDKHVDLMPPPDYPEPPVSTKDSSVTEIVQDGESYWSHKFKRSKSIL